MSNFWVRTLSGILFLAIMVAGLILHPAAFAALLLLIMYISLREFLQLTMGGRFLVQQKLTLLTAGIVLVLVAGHCFYALDARWIALGIIPLLGVPISFLLSGNLDDAQLMAYPFAGLLYICLPFILATLLVSAGGEFKGFILLNIFILIWSSDIGAYCIGTLFGQKPDSRKLAPAISPKKSWWGFWGGVVLAVIMALVLHLVGWMPYGLVHSLVLGAIVSMAGVCGDLFESVWKRHFGVKDSGSCIPGHGGMLDRFDSSLFAIPAAFAYLSAFGLI